jgi:YHS domain-containing protein
MKSLLLFAMISMLSITANAQDATGLRKKHFNLGGGIAIEGYDPVAYFTLNKAVKGKKDLAVFHQGVTYYFSSTAHKEFFKANPARYEPEFYNRFFNNTLKEWNKNEASLKTKADANWPKIFH